MVHLEDGTYVIVNVGTEPKKCLDLRDGNVRAGTNIIGYHEHGGHNQMWVLTNGEGYITLQCALSQSAGVATTGHTQGAKVVIKETAEHLVLVPHQLGTYKIHVLNQQLFLRLPDSNDNTEVQLDPNALNNQVWEFRELMTAPRKL